MDQASSSFRGLTSMTSTVIPGGARIIPHILLNRGWRDSLQRLYSLSQAHCKQVVEPGFKPRLSGPTLCLRMCLMGTSPRNGDTRRVASVSGVSLSPVGSGPVHAQCTAGSALYAPRTTCSLDLNNSGTLGEFALGLECPWHPEQQPGSVSTNSASSAQPPDRILGLPGHRASVLTAQLPRRSRKLPQPVHKRMSGHVRIQLHLQNRPPRAWFADSWPKLALLTVAPSCVCVCPQWH